MQECWHFDLLLLLLPFHYLTGMHEKKNSAQAAFIVLCLLRGGCCAPAAAKTIRLEPNICYSICTAKKQISSHALLSVVLPHGTVLQNMRQLHRKGRGSVRIISLSTVRTINMTFSIFSHNVSWRCNSWCNWWRRCSKYFKASSPLEIAYWAPKCSSWIGENGIGEMDNENLLQDLCSSICASGRRQ